MKKVLMVGCLVALGMISESSLAGFVDNDIRNQITVFGKNAPTEQAYGLGNNVSLKDALSQIVPSGYVQDTSGLAPDDLERKVSWRGGKAWVEVLKDLVQPFPWVSIKVDTSNKLVSLQGEGVQKSYSPAAVVSAWRVRRGERFSDALENWRKSAGWRGVYWEAPELESDIDQSFEGTFDDAIQQLLDVLADQGVQIRARIYEGNKVVRIMEKK